jgi:hypothetical protein
MHSVAHVHYAMCRPEQPTPCRVYTIKLKKLTAQQLVFLETLAHLCHTLFRIRDTVGVGHHARQKVSTLCWQLTNASPLCINHASMTAALLQLHAQLLVLPKFVALTNESISWLLLVPQMPLSLSHPVPSHPHADAAA